MIPANFLRWLRPSGPWVLTSIHPDEPGTRTSTFLVVTEAEKWAQGQNDEGRNVYYSLNPVNGILTKKPSRADVLEMAFLHVDVDPRKDVDAEAERRRILSMLTESLPPGIPMPSAVVDSGGGYQALWRLREPFAVNGEEHRYEEAKRYNQYLESVTGADACHNVDRILRLPGTVNYPSAKKRARGRKQSNATVVACTDLVYDLGVFLAAPKVQGPTTEFGGTLPVSVSGNVRRLQSLDELPAGVSPACKTVISHGHDPMNRERWPSRSEALWWVCCELVRQGVDDETIYSIITDPEWGISESVREKGARMAKYAQDQISRAKQEAVSPDLRIMNDLYAVVMVGGKCRVMRETSEDVGRGVQRPKIEFLRVDDFRQYTAARYVEEVSARGAVRRVPIGEWWLANPGRKQYSDVVFSPDGEPGDRYNLWQGFAVSPRPNQKRLERYLDHVRNNICSGVDAHYDYLIRWMAHTVQRPGEPGHSAIVLRGKQGTGKNRFVEIFGHLFGRHFLSLHDSNHLFGQFVLHLRDCVLLLANEAFWAGNKKQEGMLKTLVTEPTLMLEGKGSNAGTSRNCLHIMMCSNERWVVPAGPDDRRFFVLDVGAARQQDSAYFEAMTVDMQSGGYEALLHMLMSMDLAGWDVRNVPKTRALREQKAMSLATAEQWWFNKLFSGNLLDDRPGWPRTVPVSEITFDYISSLRGMRNGRVSHHDISETLSRLTGGRVSRGQLNTTVSCRQVSGDYVETIKPRVYRFPPLIDCRKAWDEGFGGPYDWPDFTEQVEDPAAQTEEKVF